MPMRFLAANFVVAFSLEGLGLQCEWMTAAVLHGYKVAWKNPGRAMALAFMLILTATAVQGHAMRTNPDVDSAVCMSGRRRR